MLRRDLWKMSAPAFVPASALGLQNNVAPSRRITMGVIGTGNQGFNEIHLYRSANHSRNFIDCVLSRKEPIAPIEHAHRSITIAHLGNISLRLGRDVQWDPKTERFTNDEKANEMLSRPMRKPWSL